MQVPVILGGAALLSLSIIGRVIALMAMLSVIGVDSDQAVIFAASDAAQADVIFTSVLKKVGHSLVLALQGTLDGTAVHLVPVFGPVLTAAPATAATTATQTSESTQS